MRLFSLFVWRDQWTEPCVEGEFVVDVFFFGVGCVDAFAFKVVTGVGVGIVGDTARHAAHE
jgi:hypothetical protein